MLDTPVGPSHAALPQKTILRFWLPLAATWLMMSVEGPYVAAIIARMPDAAYNLAAFGVAFSLAWLVESPIMMLLTASNALVRDRQSYFALRRFTWSLNAILTATMMIGVTPPVFRFVTGALMGLPPEIAHLVHIATALLILWPAAIGYRRFYQGILVRHRLTRRVAYGTAVRLTSMSVTGGTLALSTSWDGSSIGATALAVGVLMEAGASRWMARHVVRAILAGPELAGSSALSQRDIIRFYHPLALTSVISLVTGPLMTFFMGRSRSPIESLAVLPVVQSLVFLFRSGGVAYQEVGVALSGLRREHEREVGRAARLLAAGASVALGLTLFTPISEVWLRQVVGLTPGLFEFALLPARLLLLLPATEYWLSFQRSRFILNGQTRVITIATAIEMSATVLALFACLERLHMVGAVAVSVAMVCGRVGSNLFMLFAARTADQS